MNAVMPIRSVTQDKLSPVRAARRERLLGAAEALFVAQGFRATSIEGIADAAGMSKVTLYGYFRDKETVFVAVAERIADALEEAVQTALMADMPFPAPLAMALTAKHQIVQTRVQRSTFASELFQAKTAHVARRFAALMDLPEAQSSIVPVIVGEARRAVALSRALEERGYLVGAIRPPTVPLGTSRLRVTFSAAHRDEDVEGLAVAMRDVLREESP